eukprot:gb/GEZN01010450.1/.p1 GENE.gb/GEZN01010450.1/~~gb/GEZN01010450.1/.p1  ORF type:complete len:154 (-),score=22.14 gb/GEZN01010450.1/:777-1187(-)
MSGDGKRERKIAKKSDSSPAAIVANIASGDSISLSAALSPSSSSTSSSSSAKSGSSGAASASSSSSDLPSTPSSTPAAAPPSVSSSIARMQASLQGAGGAEQLLALLAGLSGGALPSSGVASLGGVPRPPCPPPTG